MLNVLCWGEGQGKPQDCWAREACRPPWWDLWMMNESMGMSRVPAPDSVLLESFAFQDWWACTRVRKLVRVCACVCVCGGGKRGLVRGWAKIPNYSLPIGDDLREWVPLWILYYTLLIGQLTLNSPWFATVTVKSGAPCCFMSWVFRVTTLDAPELKYCCAKPIFTSRGMTSKNKPYSTCYSLLGCSDAVKSQSTD